MYFHLMKLGKLTRAQEGVSYITKFPCGHKNDLNWPKQHTVQNTPKIARFALSGDPPAVTSLTNDSIFNKFPQVKLLELKRGFLHHKVPLRTQKRPELAKTTSSRNHFQNSEFGSVRGSDSCYIGNQPVYFH